MNLVGPLKTGSEGTATHLSKHFRERIKTPDVSEFINQEDLVELMKKKLYLNC